MLIQPPGLVTPLFRPAIIRPGILMKVKPQQREKGGFYLKFPIEIDYKLEFTKTASGWLWKVESINDRFWESLR